MGDLLQAGTVAPGQEKMHPGFGIGDGQGRAEAARCSRDKDAARHDGEHSKALRRAEERRGRQGWLLRIAARVITLV